MAVFIAIVRSENDVGYTASFPDFPGLAVAASSLERLFEEARRKVVAQIEHRLEINQPVAVPMAADAIDGTGALMLAAIEVPDDLRIAHIELSVPALALARIDAFAQRQGLTRSALFAAAVHRWEAQDQVPRERRGENPGPTLFDFANPPELRVGAIPADVEPSEIAADKTGVSNTDDITAELERLLGKESEPTEPYRQREHGPKEK